MSFVTFLPCPAGEGSSTSSPAATGTATSTFRRGEGPNLAKDHVAVADNMPCVHCVVSGWSYSHGQGVAIVKLDGVEICGDEPWQGAWTYDYMDSCLLVAVLGVIALRHSFS